MFLALYQALYQEYKIYTGVCSTDMFENIVDCYKYDYSETLL